jgi:predicted thioesterase
MRPETSLLDESTIGMSAETTVIVSRDMTVGHLVPGMPDAYATPMMILHMEMAAGSAIGVALRPGLVSVGMHVNVRHLAATPIGHRVRAIARITRIEGETVLFDVEAWNQSRKIGDGIHRRGIVSVLEFEKRFGSETRYRLPPVSQYDKTHPSHVIRLRLRRTRPQLTLLLFFCGYASESFRSGDVAQPWDRDQDVVTLTCQATLPRRALIKSRASLRKSSPIPHRNSGSQRRKRWPIGRTMAVCNLHDTIVRQQGDRPIGISSNPLTLMHRV